MFKFKNYKKLYEIELNNRKVIDERRKELSEENIEFQQTIKFLKEEVAMLKFQLDDALGFLEQEKQCSEALRKERKNLKSKLTKCINTLAEYDLDMALKFNKTLGDNKNGKKNN